VPLNHSHVNFCSTDRDFSLYQQTSVFVWSRFHWQWQQCPTPELVSTTTSKVNKQLRRSNILQISSFSQIQTEIDDFYFDENMFWKKTIFASKNYFCQSGFYYGNQFFHHLTKTCQP